MDLNPYTFDELDAMPTLHRGQYADLKIESPDCRVWLSRMTRADGAEFDHAVEIELLINGRWTQVADYEPETTPRGWAHAKAATAATAR